jgi:hypothetical protein
MTDAVFRCTHCRREEPIGECRVPFSHGGGICLRCFTMLADIEPPHLSRPLAREVSAVLSGIDTDFFTRA